MNPPEIDKIIRQSARYPLEDGLGEAFWGIALALIGLFFFLAPVAGQYSNVAFIATVFVVSWLCRRLVTALKKRVVYPRTGMATIRNLSWGARTLLGAGIGCFVGLVVGVGLATLNHRFEIDWIPVANCFAPAAFMLFIAWKLRLPRFFVLAAFTLLAGLMASLAGMGPQRGTAAFYTALGVALLISGAITFGIYLHQAPRPQEQ